MIVEFDKELFLADHLGPPCIAVEGLQFVESFPWEPQTGPLDVLVIGHPADGCLAPDGAAAGAVDNPFENAHVFPESGPDELAVRVFAEPVHMEYARGFGQAALHLEPMAEIVAHVI